MGFTTPCFVVVENKGQATRILNKLKCIGGRKSHEVQENVPYPCICAVSTNMVSICELSELASAGFIDSGKNEVLFLSLAALSDNKDYWMQWLVRGDVTKKTNWSFNMADDISPLGLQLGYRRATAEELVAYLGQE